MSLTNETAIDVVGNIALIRQPLSDGSIAWAVRYPLLDGGAVQLDCIGGRATAEEIRYTLLDRISSMYQV